MGLSPDAIFPLNLAKSTQYQETNFWVLEGPAVPRNVVKICMGCHLSFLCLVIAQEASSARDTREKAVELFCGTVMLNHNLILWR